MRAEAARLWFQGHKPNQRLRSGGGEDEDRTHDLYIANVALSQLSYPPDQAAVYQ